MWTVLFHDRFTGVTEEYATREEAFAAAKTAHQDDGVTIYNPEGKKVYDRPCLGQFW